MPSGVVYILRNPYFVGLTGTPLLKIGGSSRSGRMRARELSSATGVPGSFEVLHEFETNNWAHLEALAFSELKQYRRAGEFFEVDFAQAVTCITSIKDRLQYLITAPDYCRDSDSLAGATSRVTFIGNPKNSILDIVCDGLSVGQLMSDSTSAHYSLYDNGSCEEILSAEIFSVPSRRAKWSKAAVSHNSKRRASWIAQIMQAFLRDGAIQQYEVTLERLPICRIEALCGLVECSATDNLYMRARIFRMNEAARVSSSSYWNRMFATVSMSALKWHCAVNIGYQVITFTFEAPVAIEHNHH